jgi:hypothetical protein
VWLGVKTSRAAIWAVFRGSYCIASSLGVHVEGGANVSAPGCIRDNMPLPAALQLAAMRPLAKCLAGRHAYLHCSGCAAGSSWGACFQPGFQHSQRAAGEAAAAFFVGNGVWLTVLLNVCVGFCACGV